MSVRKQDNPALYKRIEEQNLLRQYDLLYNCIEIGLEKGIEEGFHLSILRLITKRFPTIASLAQTQLATVKQRAILETLFDNVSVVQTADEAKKYLWEAVEASSQRA